MKTQNKDTIKSEKMATAEVLQSIKDTRNREIAGMNASYEDKTKIQVQQVMFLGKGKNSGMDFYRVTEIDARQEPPKTFYKYYDQDNNLLGVQILQDGKAEWLPISGRDGDLWDIIREDMQKCVEEREEELHKLAKELGIKEDEIENLSEIELEQEIQENGGKLSDGEEKQDDDEKSKDDKLELTEEEQKEFTTSGIKELETDKKMDEKGNSLGKLLDLEEYDRLMVVYSQKLSQVEEKEGVKSERSNSSYAILGVRYEGGRKVVERIPSDKLQLYRGYNNTSVRFDDNSEVVKDEKTTARFVNPKTNRGIAMERTPHEIKAYYQAGRAMDNTAVMERIEDGHTGRIPVETKEVFNQNKGVRHFDDIDQETDGQVENQNPMKRENADGDFQTQSWSYQIKPDSKINFEGKMMTAAEVAESPRFKISPEYFCKICNECIDEGIDDVEEIYDIIEEEVNGQMPNKNKE